MYRHEAERAFLAWSQLVLEAAQLSGSAGPEILTACESMCTEADRDEQAISIVLHRLKRQGELERFQRFIHLVVSEYPSNEHMVHLVGYLVAGPVELRDGKFALDTARKAFERRDDEKTRKYLGWALFRDGLWEECLETLAPEDSEVYRTKISSNNSAIIAMSLWHLGKKAEAAVWLGDGHDRELAKQIQDREEKAKRGTMVFPTSAMLQRLDKEAQELVGSDPGSLDRNELIAQYYSQADTSDANALIARGRWYRWYQSQADHVKAIQDFTTAIELEPETTDVIRWRSRGISLYALEQDQNALASDQGQPVTQDL